MTTAAIAHRVDRVGNTEATHWRPSEVILAVAVAGALGLLLVQPWESIPFPIYDFGGWLARLSSLGSAGAGFRELVMEHAREGRVNPLSMAYVALNWALFDARPLGWQLVRATIMLGVIGGAFALCRTLGAKRGAALVGASLFVVADSARSVWMLPQAFEHVAACLILLASLLAAGYHATTRPRRSALAIAALLVLAIWVREPMVAAVPFVLLLALSHRGDGRLERPRPEPRATLLVAIVGGTVTVLNVVPVIAVRFLERSSGYASRFGPENISADNVRNVLSALTLPVTREPFFPANVLFALAIVVAGLGVGAAARRYRTMVLLAATLPLCAAAIYVMWPSFPGNYALPYLPGIALAFALALSRLWEASTTRRALAVTAAAGVLGYGALLTMNGRREYAAARLLDSDMARYASTMPLSRLIVAVDDPRVSGDFGRGLAAYATVLSGQGPAQASDVECTEAQQYLGDLPRDVVVLRAPDRCGTIDVGTAAIVLTRTAFVRDWKTLRSRQSEATAAFWHRAAAQ